MGKRLELGAPSYFNAYGNLAPVDSKPAGLIVVAR
jgi:hypothetical protein